MTLDELREKVNAMIKLDLELLGALFALENELGIEGLSKNRRCTKCGTTAPATHRRERHSRRLFLSELPGNPRTRGDDLMTKKAWTEDEIAIIRHDLQQTPPT
jgi:hypothetical protein